MTSILTNTAAMSALSNLTATQRQLSSTQAQVSSGLAVGSASDNAAYWSIATYMKSEVSGIAATEQSLSLTGALMDVTSKALSQVILQVQGIQSDLVSAQESGVLVGSIQSDIAARQASISSIVLSSSFNGINLLASSQTTSNLSEYDEFDQITQQQYYSGYLGDTHHFFVQFGSAGTHVSENTVHLNGDGSFVNLTPLTDDGVIDNSSSTQYFNYVSSFNNTAHFSSANITGIILLAPAEVTTQYSLYFGQSVGQSTHVDVSQTSAVSGAGLLDTPFQETGSSSQSLMNFDITSLTAAEIKQLGVSVSGVLSSLTSASTKIGAIQTEVSTQQTFNSALSDCLTSGIGSLVDADMNVASTRLQALQTQQQLGIQALSMANQNSQLILKLFQAA